MKYFFCFITLLFFCSYVTDSIENNHALYGKWIRQHKFFEHSIFISDSLMVYETTMDTLWDYSLILNFKNDSVIGERIYSDSTSVWSEELIMTDDYLFLYNLESDLNLTTYKYFVEADSLTFHRSDSITDSAFLEIYDSEIVFKKTN